MAIIALGDCHTGNLHLGRDGHADALWYTVQIGNNMSLEEQIQIVTSPRRTGYDYAYKFIVPPGSSDGSGERAELSGAYGPATPGGEPSRKDFPTGNRDGTGDEYYYAWSNYLPTDLITNLNQSRGILAQWHEALGGGGSVNFSVRISPDGDLVMTHNNKNQDSGDVYLIKSPPDLGEWVDFIVWLRLTCDNTGGFKCWYKRAAEVSYALPVDVSGIRTQKPWPQSSGCQGVYKLEGLKCSKGNKTRIVYATAFRQTTTLTEAQAAHPSEESKPPPEALERTGWTASADSEELVQENNAASNVLDGDPNTYWHTQWGTSESQPHTLDIDMQARYELAAVEVTQKQSDANGRIKNLEVYLSNDGVDWGSAIHTATLPNDQGTHKLTFASAQVARYFRIKTLDVYGSNPTISAAGEVNAYGVGPIAAFTLVSRYHPGTVTVEDGRVTTWADAEAAGNDFVQYIDEDGPLPGPLWINEEQALKGDGGSVLVANSPIVSGTDSRTIFFAAKLDPLDELLNYLLSFGETGFGAGRVVQIDNSLAVRVGQGTREFDATLSSQNYSVVRIEIPSANLNTVRMFIDGVEQAVASSASVALDTQGQSALFARMNTGVAELFGNGYLRALRVFEGTPSAAEAATIEAEMAASVLPPTLDPISDQSAVQAQTVAFNVVARHDDAPPTVTLAMADASPLPAGVNFTLAGTNGNEVTYAFSWPTLVGQAGSYDFVATASHSGLESSDTFNVTLLESPHSIAPRVRRLSIKKESRVVRIKP